MAKPDLAIHETPIAIRPAMPDYVRHAIQNLPIDGVAVQIKNSTDAAHEKNSG